MAFRITGLDPQPFIPLYDLPEEQLAAQGAIRYRAEPGSGFPDRIELRDAEPGETVLLVNHLHQPAETPYKASHAIFVREGAQTPYDQTDEIPLVLRTRILSLRAFDAEHMMIDADLVNGEGLEDLLKRYLAEPDVAYLQAHFAKRGCFAARIDRA